MTILFDHFMFQWTNITTRTIWLHDCVQMTRIHTFLGFLARTYKQWSEHSNVVDVKCILVDEITPPPLSHSCRGVNNKKLMVCWDYIKSGVYNCTCFLNVDLSIVCTCAPWKVLCGCVWCSEITARDISLWKKWWPLEGPTLSPPPFRCSENTGKR